MSSETPIKPGDVVRWTEPFLNEPVVAVVATVDRDDWAMMIFPDVLHGVVVLGMICGPTREAIRLGAADSAASQAATLYVAALPADSGEMRTLARKEALARGWRELDREDVTDEPWDILVWAGDREIGRLRGSRVRDGERPLRWVYLHFSDPGGMWAGHDRNLTLDEARAALLAAENARRAQERK